MKIHIPTPLRQYADKKDAVEVAGKSVGEALANLTSQYADLRRQLFTEDGKLRAFVNVYLNDEDIRYLQREQTPVKPGDSLSIVPSVAGGAPTGTSPSRAGAGVQAGPALSQDEIRRYSRHLIMPEVGMEGQQRLK
ncbi:MAG: ubiquitin-like small modifier protein 1, partial [Terriglobales bacterium]